ncbi:MAG: DNA-processing protein DprA [Gemmatimonadales bacterium]
MTTATASEQAAVLALTRATPAEWFRTATVIYEVGSALAVLDGRTGLLSDVHHEYAAQLRSRVRSEHLQEAERLVERAATHEARLLTVLDKDYPANLQLVYNRPPFIWVRGNLLPDDFRAIAIVGTRQASEDGLSRAARLASSLARNGVTVLSGLARGIDTAAHRATLDVKGRTIAVLGTGILSSTYPKENKQLTEDIVKNGALISQFWPDAPPRRAHFPMRNIVMSGMAMGTVVVEASSTSGAKMQARLALEHGKRLFLLESLVQSQDWAKKYAERPGTTIVRQLDDVLNVLVKLANEPQQLELTFSD